LKHDAFLSEKTKQDTFISIKFRHRFRYFLGASAFVSRVLPASFQMTVNNDGCFMAEGRH